MEKERRKRKKRDNYTERKNKDGTVSRFSIPTVNGKPKWIKIPDKPEYLGKKGARRHLDEMRRKYNGDWTTDRFEDGAAQYLDFIKNGKTNTYIARETAIRKHLMPFFEGKRIIDITRADVQNFINEYAPRLSRNYMRAGIIATLALILKQYMKKEQLPRNVASSVDGGFDYPPIPETDRRVSTSHQVVTKTSADGRTLIDGGRALTGEQVQEVLRHAKPFYWPIFLVLFYLGLRLSEMIAMQWKYLEQPEDGSDKGRYFVEKQLSKRADGLVEPKTIWSRAPVVVSPYVLDALEEQRAIVAKFRLAAGNEWIDNDLIFPRLQSGISGGRHHDPGTWLGRRTIYRQLVQTSERAEVGHLRPHDTRHTCASLLISAGENIKVVSTHMRHKDVKTTLDIYGHLYEGDIDKIADAIDEALDVRKIRENG